MNLTQIVMNRYATKKFDPSKRISQADFEQIKTLLRFSPSSVNSQPWHFVIADSLESRKRMTKGTQGPFSANEQKVLDASHVILFCAKTDLSDDYLHQLTDVEDEDGRFADQAGKDMVNQVRAFYANMHRLEQDDTQEWMEKQVYLNMGTLLLGAGALEIDAVPIEGMDPKVLNEEFDLPRQGYTALAMVALGYRAEDDFNAKLPKSRLPEEEIFTFLD